MTLVYRHLPLVIALIVFVGAIDNALNWMLFYNEGHLIYSLDDPYILMAVAKNLALHGVWGVTPYEVANASTSILYPIVLAGLFRVFGVLHDIPFILNSFLAALTLATIHLTLRRYRVPWWLNLPALILTIYVTPLVVHVFVSMGAVMQIWLSVTFVALAVDLLSREHLPPLRSRSGVALLLLTLGVATIRYEGTLLVAMTGLLFLLRRRLDVFVALALVAGTPLLLFGLWTISQGATFFPNATIARVYTYGDLRQGNLSHYLDLGRLYERLIERERLILLVMAFIAPAWAIYMQRRKIWEPYFVASALIAGTIILHANFAETGWFWRYEAYLFALLCAFVPLNLAHLLRSDRDEVPAKRPLWLGYLTAKAPTLLALAVLGLTLFTPLQKRAHKSYHDITLASRDIYRQQVQTGRFLQRYYTGANVVLNDIGAPTFLADFHLLDIWGLGSDHVARALSEGANRVGHAFLRGNIAEHDMDIAILFEGWFGSALPPQWERVGRWILPERNVAGNTVLTFFAERDSPEADQLLANLIDFAPELPQVVGVELLGQPVTVGELLAFRQRHPDADPATLRLEFEQAWDLKTDDPIPENAEDLFFGETGTWVFGNTFDLRRVDVLDEAALITCDPARIHTWWRLPYYLDQLYGLEWLLTDDENQIIERIVIQPDALDLARWPIGERYRHEQTLRWPCELPEGDYRFWLGVINLNTQQNLALNQSEDYYFLFDTVTIQR